MRDRRHRLARLLDLWVETVPVVEDTFERWESTMGDCVERVLTLEYDGTVKHSLQGRIFAPLYRFAAVGVAAKPVSGRAQIGQIHTADNLDGLGGSMLVKGMGFGIYEWHPQDTRFLVMNLDRDEGDPSLNVNNVIGGLLFAERSWPDVEE